jgi:hypothetical protein
MPSAPGPLDLEDLVITAYAALDDALKHAGIEGKDGKLIPRRGPKPDFDDREVLCLAMLQEWLGYDSDLSYCQWLEGNKTMRSLFPKMISRQKWAERC